jgi:transcriptional regulator with XRE-family HTH domain
MRAEVIADFAAIVRGRRLDLGLTQAALAKRAGVGRQWISEFEKGKPGTSIALLLRTLHALDLYVDITAVKPHGVVDLDEMLAEYASRD